MPNFSYSAVRSDGSLRTGSVQSTDRALAIASLQDQGMVILDLQLADQKITIAGLLTREIDLGGRRGSKTAFQFIGRLALLLGAGVSVEQALQLIADPRNTPGLASLAASLLQKIRSGANLAHAMGSEQGYFSPEITAVVRAGEASGGLGSTLEQLSVRMERAEAARSALVSALLYPTMLIFTAIMAILLILTTIIPELEPIFAEASDQTPWIAAAAFALSGFIRGYWPPFVASLIAALGIFVVLWRTPNSRATIDRVLLRLPFFGTLLRKSETARFARVLGALVGGGVPLSSALKLCEPVAGNTKFVQAITSISKAVREGARFSQAVQAETGFPPLFPQMIQIGEATAQLPAILGKTAEILETEVQEALGRFLTILVPSLTFLLGAFVAGVIGSVMMVVTSINDLVK